jgi:hypothetical protein
MVTQKLVCDNGNQELTGLKFNVAPFFSYVDAESGQLKYVLPGMEFGGRSWLYVQVPELNVTGWAPVYQYQPGESIR